MPLAPGQQLGPYEILAQLGEVCKARAVAINLADESGNVWIAEPKPTP